MAKSSFTDQTYTYLTLFFFFSIKSQLNVKFFNTLFYKLATRQRIIDNRFYLKNAIVLTFSISSLSLKFSWRSPRFSASIRSNLNANLSTRLITLCLVVSFASLNVSSTAATCSTTLPTAKNKIKFLFQKT